MARQAAREPIATWWRIGRNRIEIEAVPVLAFTDKTVTFWNGYREERNMQSSDYYDYLPTWDDARALLLTRFVQKAHNAECTLADMRSKVEKIRAMLPPQPEGLEG